MTIIKTLYFDSCLKDNFFAFPAKQLARLTSKLCHLPLAILMVAALAVCLPTPAQATLPPSPKDWTLKKLQDELGSKLTKNTDDGRWEIPGKDFWPHVPKPLRDMNRSRQTFDLGCVGISMLFAGSNWSLPAGLFDNCYFDEARALAKMQRHECPQGYTPNIIAIRFWDHNKAVNDRTPNEADGRVPNAKQRYDKGEARSDEYVNFDFGYRLADGSYIHANHMEPGMKVKVSKDANTYNRNGTYAGFNSLLFCVLCVADLSSAESSQKFREANKSKYPDKPDSQQ